MSLRNHDSAASRSAARFQAGLPTVASIATQSYTCDAHNLSRTGVLLTGELPPVRGPVALRISTAAGDVELEVEGLIRRYTPGSSDEPAQVGVEFGPLDEETRQTLDLVVSRVVEGLVPAPLETLGANPTPEAIRAALEKITLAHRMNFAARGSIKERELMRHDPDLKVIDAIARNPQLTLPEAQELLRRRPLLPQTLDAIARNPRWTSNPKMAVDIAAHPSTRLAVAEKLVRAMNPTQRRDLLNRPGLHAVIREKLLQKKL